VQGQIVIHDKKDPVLILGSLLEFSSGADFAFGAADAVQQAIEQANAAGGVLGADIVLFTRDTGEPGSGDVRLPAQELIEKGAQALIGPMFSSNTQLILEDIVLPSGVPLVSPSNTLPTLADIPDNGLYFRMSDSEALRGVIGARRACELGHASAAVILEYPQDSLDGLAQAFAAEFALECGGTVLAQVYISDFGDPHSVLQAVFDAHSPDMVFLGVFDRFVAVELVQEAFCVEHPQEPGRPAFERYWLSAFEFTFSDDFSEQVAQGNSCGAPAEPGVLAGYEDLAPAFYYDWGGMETVFSNLAYDAAALVILAAEEAESIDGYEIAQHLHSVSSGGTPVFDLATALDLVRAGEDIDWQGSFQRPAELGYADYNHDFEPDGETISPYVFRQIQANGALVFLTEEPDSGQLAFYVPNWIGSGSYVERAFAAFGLASMLEAQLGSEVRAVVPSGEFGASQAAVTAALNSGQADIALLDWLAYLVAHEASGADAFLSMAFADQTYYQSQLLAHADSGIPDIHAMDGRSLCWVDPLSTSGYIVPSLMLIAAGLDPEDNASFSFGHDAVVENIYQQHCEAGAAFVDARDLLADPYPDVYDVVLRIGISAEIPNTGFVSAGSLDAGQLDGIQDALLAIAGTPQGAAWLDILFSADLRPIDHTAYEGMEALLEDASLTPEQAWGRFFP
jgi:phosphate/phosphite/phosphonate ABC transporter binding protein